MRRSFWPGLAPGTAARLTRGAFFGLLYAGFAETALFDGLTDNLARAPAEDVSLSAQSCGQLAGESLCAAVSNDWAEIANAWPAFLVGAVLGFCAAVGRYLGGRHQGLARFGLLTALFTYEAWMVAQRDQIPIRIAEAPELYRRRCIRMRTRRADISIIRIFSVTAAAPNWMAWRWRFRFSPSCARPWRSRGRVPAYRTNHGLRAVFCGRPARPSSAWSAVIVCVNAHFNASTLRLNHGACARSPNASGAGLPLALASDVRKIRGADINGEGSVAVRRQHAETGQTTAVPIANWTFNRRAEQEYRHQEISLFDVPAGRYLPAFQPRAGWGGYELP